MRVTSNTEELINSLIKKREEVEKKLTGMVQKFIYHIGSAAIDNTPFGSLVNQETGEINMLYQLPSRLRTFPLGIPGQAKGGWLLFQDNPHSYQYGSVSTKDGTAPKLAIELNAKDYILGQTLYLMNNVPYVATAGWTNGKFGSLEGGYSKFAPTGIKGPTIIDIQRIYNGDLKSFYAAS